MSDSPLHPHRSSDPGPVLGAALAAFDRGFIPVPLRPSEKMPAISGWQRFRPESADDVRSTFEKATAAHGEVGVGLSLGEPSGGLVDVDLDTRLAINAARYFLPMTSMRSGRPTNQASHWWYRVTDDLPEHTQRITFPRWTDAEGERQGGEVIIELRTTGAQTVIPPSWHPAGEQYDWLNGAFGGDSGPREISGRDLRARVLLISFVSTLAADWPKRGGRHDAYLALAGMMLFERTETGGKVNDVWRKNAPAVISALADLTHDDDGGDARVEEVIPTTLQRIERGDRAQGYPTLATLMPEHSAAAARRILRDIEKVLGYVREVPSVEDLEPQTPLSGDETVGESPEYPDEQKDAESVEQPPLLLDLSDTIAQQMIRNRAREYQINEEARRQYNEAKQPEVEIDLQPLAIVAQSEPDPEPRIENFLPWMGGSLLVAQAKTGKTTMCLNMARSLLTGEPFMGKFQVRPIEQHRKVALLNFEMSPAQMAEWCLKRDLPQDRFILLNQKGKGNPFRRETDRAKLAEALREWDVETIIVDTFAAVYVGESQNDANEVRPWLEELLRWTQQDVGASDLILTAHAGWSAEGRPRGSSALVDWADMTTYLTCEDPADRNAPRYVHTAGRIDGLAKVKYTHDETTLAQAVKGDAGSLAASTSFDIDPGPLAAARDALIETLLSGDGRPMKARELDSSVQLRAGCSREIARSARYEATNGGWVATRPAGRNSVEHVLADGWDGIYDEAFPEE